MARSRIIKPEFFFSEDIWCLDFAARLFYLGFWVQADDSGIYPHKPRILKALIFPNDVEIDIEKSIEDCVTCGVLVRYTIKETTYLKVAQWDRHQAPKYPTYKYPLPDGTIPTQVPRVSQLYSSCNSNSNSNRSYNWKENKGLLSEKLRTDKVFLILDEFERYRCQEVKKPLTDIARTRLANRLASLSGEKPCVAVQLLRDAMDSQWTTIWPNRTSRQGKSKKQELFHE